jgi:cobalt-zinc-cadmium efflux system outer membrane protein
MKRILPVLSCLLCVIITHAQQVDSLRLSLSQAEETFIKKNLLLAAEQYNIDAAKALEIQAKLYPNPEFSADLHGYDTDTRKVFYNNRSGQKGFAIEQLLLLGGKRKNEIALARHNTQLAVLEFEDLVRHLKYNLRTNLYTVHFHLKTVEKYNKQLLLLDTIISSYQRQAEKGNIPLVDVVRLKSTYIKLTNDKSEVLQNILQAQQELQVLLLTDRFIIPDLDNINWQTYTSLPDLALLQQEALTHRSDQKIGILNRTIAGLEVKYQKSMAVPDLTAGAAYDQQGDAFRNQYNIKLGIPLPIWNRNQGNIKMAKAKEKQSAVNSESVQQSLFAETRAAWYNMGRSINEYDKTTAIYNEDFTHVLKGVSDNFLKRNITLLEFVDFFESYNETTAELYRVQQQLITAAETINYVTASAVFN